MKMMKLDLYQKLNLKMRVSLEDGSISDEEHSAGQVKKQKNRKKTERYYLSFMHPILEDFFALLGIFNF